MITIIVVGLGIPASFAVTQIQEVNNFLILAEDCPNDSITEEDLAGGILKPYEPRLEAKQLQEVNNFPRSQSDSLPDPVAPDRPRQKDYG